MFSRIFSKSGEGDHDASFLISKGSDGLLKYDRGKLEKMSAEEIKKFILVLAAAKEGLVCEANSKNDKRAAEENKSKSLDHYENQQEQTRGNLTLKIRDNAEEISSLKKTSEELTSEIKKLKMCDKPDRAEEKHQEEDEEQPGLPKGFSLGAR